MMSKSMIVLAALLACASAQYQYSAILDSEGEFIIRWNIRDVSQEIEMRFEVKTKGWISLLVGNPDGIHTDVWFGGYNDTSNSGYIGDYHFWLEGGGHVEPDYDPSQDLVLQNATYTESTGLTTLTIQRLLNTGDVEDDEIILKGPLLLGWSFQSISDNIADTHTKAGFATLTLIP